MKIHAILEKRHKFCSALIDGMLCFFYETLLGGDSMIVSDNAYVELHIFYCELQGKVTSYQKRLVIIAPVKNTDFTS